VYSKKRKKERGIAPQLKKKQKKTVGSVEIYEVVSALLQRYCSVVAVAMVVVVVVEVVVVMRLWHWRWCGCGIGGGGGGT